MQFLEPSTTRLSYEPLKPCPLIHLRLLINGNFTRSCTLRYIRGSLNKKTYPTFTRVPETPEYVYFVVLLIPFTVLIRLYGPFRFKARLQNWERRILALSLLSVSSSGHPYWTSRLPLDGFLWNLKLENFSKIYQNNSSLIKTWQEWQVIYIKNCIYFL